MGFTCAQALVEALCMKERGGSVTAEMDLTPSGSSDGPRPLCGLAGHLCEVGQGSFPTGDCRTPRRRCPASWGWGMEAVRGQVSWLGWQGAFREGCTAWGNSRDPGREALPSPQLSPPPPAVCGVSTHRPPCARSQFYLIVSTSL